MTDFERAVAALKICRPAIVQAMRERYGDIPAVICDELLLTVVRSAPELADKPDQPVADGGADGEGNEG